MNRLIIPHIVILLILFIVGFAYSGDYVDDNIYTFQKVPCSEYGFSEKKYSNPDSTGYQIVSIEEWNLSLKYKSNSLNYARFNKKKYYLPPIENLDFEYYPNPSKDISNKTYQKKVGDKYQLIVVKSVDKGFFSVDMQFEQNKCFITTIPKAVIEAEQKAKADAEQKTINDANNKKRWASQED